MTEYTIEDYLVEKLAGRLRFVVDNSSGLVYLDEDLYKRIGVRLYVNGPIPGLDPNDSRKVRNETYDEWKSRMTET